MNIVDLIIKKRNNQSLNRDEIRFFVKSTVSEEIYDYQISAMLMAIFLNGLTDEETAFLTLEMANSGETFDLSSIKGIKVDKHSTGGVADTTTLILSPLVASLGIPVIKMSGRGLGFSGGTIDKLESIPGFNTNISQKEALGFAEKSGIVLMGQSANLTPADKKLYALRDVTGTVESIPLIASSIMSKKIAAGCDSIVLDVKCGNGAFMKDLHSAKMLAEKMVSIGKMVNRKVVAVISSMNQPLGSNIGNSLEVIEAIEILKGNISGDLLDVSLTLGSHMLILANIVNSVEEGKFMLLNQIKNGKGLLKLKELIIQQNGNPKIIDDYSLFKKAKESLVFKAPKSGYIFEMETELIGKASIETGAGRRFKEEKIDLGAGIILNKRIGEYVNSGDITAEIFADNKEKCSSALEILNSAIKIDNEKPIAKDLILEIIK